MTETLIGESAGQDSTNDTLRSIPHNDNNAGGNGTETLPNPLPQIGPQARNYVAYIPVPISDDEAEDDDYEEYDDDEYKDDDEEYYEDDEDEYYDEEDYEYEIKKPKRPTKKQKNR